MIEIIYYVASSLDGYIAEPNDGLDWLESFSEGGEDYGYAEFYASIDSLVLGSRTYEMALAHGDWQSPDKPSWVFTHRDLQVAHPSITLTADAPSDIVEALGKDGFKRVWLMGGGLLAASFRQQGLITHYEIAMIPVVLGAGIPLFADVPRQDRLRLTNVNTFPTGVVQLSYEADSKA
jgi:dihydrofolate reductase